MKPRVIVVGGGLAGAAVAAGLRNVAEVRVLEQGPAPAREASAQNAGMVRRLGEDPYERVLALRTHERLERIARREEGGFPEGVVRTTGAVLALCDEPQHLNDAVSEARLAGVTVASVGAKDLSRLAPELDGARLSAAFYLPDEQVVDANSLVAGLLRPAGGSPIPVACGVRVRGLEQVGGQVCGVRVLANGREETLPADAVVLAAGAWSADLAARVGLHRPLQPVRRSLHWTGEDPKGVPAGPWIWVDDVGVYVRPEGSGWLASGCDEAVGRPGPGPDSGGPPAELAEPRAVDKLRTFFPRLGTLPLKGGWSGWRTFAPDRRPVLGPDPELSGLHWCAGLGGFGVSCGLAAGEVVADWLMGRSVGWMRPEGVSPTRAFSRRWPIRPEGSLSRAKLVGLLPPDPELA